MDISIMQNGFRLQDVLCEIPYQISWSHEGTALHQPVRSVPHRLSWWPV